MVLSYRSDSKTEKQSCARFNSGSEENEIHVLLQCPAYSKIRKEMSKQMRGLWRGGGGGES